MKDKNLQIPINQDEISSYLKDIRKLKVMTVERERLLSERICSDSISERERQQIYKELLEGNLRFVITVAKQYQNQGLELSDLVAEGNVGLLKAINNFDWTKKLRFISYAVWWIRQSILQSLNEHARTIRLPVNVVQELFKEKKLIDRNGGELSDKFTNEILNNRPNKKIESEFQIERPSLFIALILIVGLHFRRNLLLLFNSFSKQQ